jgi:recombination protein RecA
MPPKTKKEITQNNPGPAAPQLDNSEDFSAELIKQLNREAGDKIAFNLGDDDAPTNVRRWIHTGSKLLDYCISNRRNGGFPEGRIIEIQGPPSCGKSHLAFEAAKATQAMGGVVVYIDTENATSPDNLRALGIDVKKNFVFIQTNCTEDVLKWSEAAIIKSRSMNKDVPMTIIWDSVAACSPKAELEGQYEDNSIGLQARVLSKGMRKISNVIANEKVLFLLINQQRMKIGVLYGDPTTTPGGSAIPYATSVRLRVMTGQPIKAEKDRVIGINVEVKVIKNKVAKPFRSAELSIIFGKGVIDDEQTFDVLRAHCDAKGPVKAGGKRLLIEGTGGWKTFSVTDDSTGEVLHEVKFNKSDFRAKVLSVPEYQGYIADLLDAAMVMGSDDNSHASFKGADSNSLEEMRKQENE